MRYIGPFFRMNSLSQKDISGQLFHLSKEAIKTIVLDSKCGILSSFRSSKKSSTHDISILKDFYPLLCIYKKASPVFIHSKSSRSFDESSFKKEINPGTNALMTLCVLELSNYYSNYKNCNKNIKSLEKSYEILAKEQLTFYYENLRNSEGVFVDKKNISDGNSKGYNLIEKDKKFDFSDQAFMMNAYYLFSLYYPNDEISEEFKSFSLQILDMFFEFKEALYNLSFDEGCEILLAFNVFYSYSEEERCKDLIIDLSDFLINKFDEKDYFINSLDSCCIFALDLNDAFKHTNILSFKEKRNEILEKLNSLYDEDKGIIVKLTEKKEYKYSSLELCLYLLSILMDTDENESPSTRKSMISNVYRKYFINSGIVSSWPEAPTLDEVERYRGLSLHSDDMLDETFFRMPSVQSPQGCGVAPIFCKNVTYSRKKDSFSTPKNSFDSRKNMFIFFNFIYYLKDEIIDTMNFKSDINLVPKESKSNETLNNIETNEINNLDDNKLSIEETSKSKEITNIDTKNDIITTNTDNTLNMDTRIDSNDNKNKHLCEKENKKS